MFIQFLWNEKKRKKNEKLLLKKSQILNKNTFLENVTIHLKIIFLPEFFNICLMNNIAGLKMINLEYFNEISFIDFMECYKKNIELLKKLTNLKIKLKI